MTRPVGFKPEAIVDQIEIGAYLSNRSIAAGERFASSLSATYLQLGAIPELGTLQIFKHLQLVEVRLWPVQNFPRYIVFYQHTAEELTILRILHSSRDWAAILES